MYVARTSNQLSNLHSLGEVWVAIIRDARRSDDLGEASLQLGQSQLFELVHLVVDVVVHAVLRPLEKSIGAEDMEACVPG